jgi:peptidoglycan/xylan/chitin deacetylase (PgdA/CDA1 family)
MNLPEKPEQISERFIPLVLHRIVRGTACQWEDVSVPMFKQMLARIEQYWCLFDGRSATAGARWQLTFDDGAASDYEIAFPLLLESGIRAAFFLIADAIGSQGHITWGQAAEMHRHGMQIGSHSSTHRRLTILTPTEAEQELRGSRQRLEDHLGAPVTTFSYPFGECSLRLHQLCFAAGYELVYTSSHGVAHSGRQVFPRNAIHSKMSWREIEAVMTPQAGTRLYWILENQAKEIIKGTLGLEHYTHWRNRLFGDR